MKAFKTLLFFAVSASCIAGDLRSEAGFEKFCHSKNYKGGVAAYTREINTHPGDAVLLTRLGQLHFAFQKYPEARTTLERAIAIDPNQALAHSYLGLVSSHERRAAAALDHFDRAIKSEPTNADFHFNRAVVLIADIYPPNKPAAREAYKRAISLGGEPDTAFEQLLK